MTQKKGFGETDIQDHHVRDFVLKFLDLAGAEVKPKGSLYRVFLPAGLARFLEVERELDITFSIGVAKKNKACELLVPGNALLDQFIALARTRGHVAHLIVPQCLEPEFCESMWVTDPWGPVETGKDGACHGQIPIDGLRAVQPMNGKLRLLETRFLSQPQFLFTFRVAYVTDERREEIESLLLDPITELVEENVDYRAARTLDVPLSVHHKSAPGSALKQRVAEIKGRDATTFPTKHPDKQLHPLNDIIRTAKTVLPEGNYTLLRLFQKACLHLETQIENKVQTITREANKGLERDKQRLDEYYTALRAEELNPVRRLFKQMAASRMRYALATYEDEKRKWAERLKMLREQISEIESQGGTYLDELSAAKQKHVQELEEKYALKVEVCLVRLARILVPQVEYVVRFVGRERSQLSLRYDVIRKRLVDFSCAACEQPLSSFVVCPCGDIVCPDCTSKDLAKPACPACTEVN